MPVSKAKSSVFAKYGKGIDQMVTKHANDPTEYGPDRLPPGINNGVAQLIECRFEVIPQGKQNAGEVQLVLAGMVIEPEYVSLPDGRREKVAGRQTRLWVPCCTTKTQDGKVTPQEENVETAMNHFRMLGGEEFTAGARTGADLENLAALLTEQAPYFRFKTSQSKATEQYPDPRVWENWLGTKGLGEYVPPENRVGTGSGVDEGGGEAGEPAAGGGDQAGTFTEFGDLDSLRERAEADDEKARAELTLMARRAGHSDDDILAAPDWASVVEMINTSTPNGQAASADSEPVSPDPEPDPEPEQEWEPKKEEVYLYKPVDPKTGKPLMDPKTKKPAKGVEVEVVAVDKKTKTVKLKNIDRGTLYERVKWEALESAA